MLFVENFSHHPRTFTQTQLPPTVITTEATGLGANSATLNGQVNANNLSTNVFFEFGFTTEYGNVAAGVPPIVNGEVMTDVSAIISGLTSNTTYHFRAVGTNEAELLLPNKFM